MIFPVDLTAPMPTLAAGADGVAALVPAPTLDTGATAVLTASMYTLAVTSVLEYSAVAAVAPMSTMAASGYAGTVGTLSQTVPAPLLAAHSAGLDDTVPAPVLDAEVLVGTLSSVGQSLPMFTLEATLIQNPFGVVDVTVPMPRLTASLLSETLGTVAATLPAAHLSAIGFTGNVGTVGANVPAYEIDALGYGPYVLTAALPLPMPSLDAVATAAVASAFRTWVLNTRKKAMTEYDYAFNSYAHFRGVLLSAGSTGLFKHTGENSDAGTAIAARVRTGKESFGTSYGKRVPRIYVGYETGGAMRFKTITSQDGARTYLLPHNGITGVQQRRVPVGRGPKSPYWQFEIANVEGCDFLIENLQAYPEKSRRRVV
jgi:hypothetical protein